jgi:fatty-acyl-CoA synthase
MFHCNGWCFTWAVTAAGGTRVCLRTIDTAEVWRLLRDEGITHFSAAPTVLTMIAEDPAAGELDREVRLARYKVPQRFEFGELPKTSTGKIQKTVLRDRASELKES